MADHHRYVIHENIERFETLLQSGQLDREQTAVVRMLLAQARADLAMLEGHGCAVGPRSRDRTAAPVEGLPRGGMNEPVRLSAGAFE